GFTYRSSSFKREPGRWVVLAVSFGLQASQRSAPIRYPELARALDVEVGARAPLAEVREAVLALRRGKGMVLDPDDHDTWSAGSFFTNPVVPPGSVPVGAPSWPADGPEGDDRVKTSAAWLIDQAGFGKGYGSGPATLSSKHVLALTNRGTGTTAGLLDLAREIRDGVRAAYGVTLVNEPVLVGCEL
ncbi:MAG: UDP-N-acetylmuramate dehydrogenase, partial [Aeromicrobium sp.]